MTFPSLPDAKPDPAADRGEEPAGPATVHDYIECFVAGSERDWLQLWEVIEAARSATDADSAQDDVTRTLALVGRLLDRGFRVGDLPQGIEFVTWANQDRAYIQQRIEREWRALGREPNLWEVCWFHLPGDRR